MCQDRDVKIFDAGSSNKKPEQNFPEVKLSKEDLMKAKTAGERVAKSFIEAVSSTSDDEANDFELLHQRRLLLSFTANIGFERFISNEELSERAKRSFLNSLKAEQKDIYETAVDTGAFSFYYLAYRRANEVERRMGQTFAMLCSHDGDPIFQELGEAIYCWFSSETENIIKEIFE